MRLIVTVAIGIAVLMFGTAFQEPVPKQQPVSKNATRVLPGSNIYVDSSGHQITGPPSDEAKPVRGARKDGVTRQLDDRIQPTTSTGPYRRVFSTPGYSDIRAIVFLPCRAAKLIGDEHQYDIENGFVYTGGWGVGRDGQGVDAGFQKSSFQDGSPRDNYALFMMYKGHYIVKQHDTDPDLRRYPCDHDVAIEFKLESRTRFSLSAHLLTKDSDGQWAMQQRLYIDHEDASWPPDGGGRQFGVVLKRMTSIGQPGVNSGVYQGLLAAGGARVSQYEYFRHALALRRTTWNNDGSYFGVNQSGKLLVRWHDVWIGRANSPSSMHPWRDSDTFNCHNVPDNGHVRVQFSTYSNELDGIVLRTQKTGVSAKPRCAEPLNKG